MLHHYGINSQEVFTVDLQHKKYSCGRFQEYYIPCAHAALFISQLNEDPGLYCSYYHTQEYNKQIYQKIKGHKSSPTVNEDLFNFQLNLFNHLFYKIAR